VLDFVPVGVFPDGLALVPGPPAQPSTTTSP
jgi:hypothetical protein